jgi:hypothetical protein
VRRMQVCCVTRIASTAACLYPPPPPQLPTHINVPGCCQLLAAPLIICASKEYQLCNSTALGSLRGRRAPIRSSVQDSQSVTALTAISMSCPG